MSGTDQLDQLRAAGFSSDEIDAWQTRQMQQQSAAGFSQDEINKYWGVQEPDATGLDTHMKTALDQHVAATTSDDGKRAPLDFTQALQAGWQGSVTGLATRGSVPNVVPTGDEGWYNRLAYNAAQMVGDAPAMVAGALAGGAGGAETGPGAAVTAAAGAFAVPTALRLTMMDAYQKGGFKTFSDFWDRFAPIAIETAKSYVTGAATGGAGQVAGKFLEGAAPAVKSIGQMGAELTTMTTVGKALNGQVPEPRDFLDGAIVLLGAKAATAGAGKLMDIYRATGVPPDRVVQDARTEPTITQDLAAGKPLPDYYKDQMQQDVPSALRATLTAEPPRPEPAAAPAEPPPAPEPGSVDAAQQSILSKIQIGGTEESQPMTWNKLYTSYLDDLAPIRKAVDQISGGAEVPAAQDPYVQARLVRGVYGKAQQFLENSPFNFKTLANEGESLKSIISPVKDDLDGLRAYAAASRAVELEGRGIQSGFDVNAAKQVVDAGTSKYEPVLRGMVDYQNRLTGYLRDSGVLSDDAYKAMVDANKNYVPFYRVLEGGDVGGPGGSSGLQTRNPIRAIKGSDRAVVDPLESVIKNTYTYVALAEKNSVAKSFYDLASKADDPSQFFEKQAPSLRPTTVTDPEMGRFLKENGIDTLPDDALTVFRAVRQPLAKDEIGFFDQGKWTVLKVDPAIADAFNATDRQFMPSLLKFLSLPAKALRAGSTLSPDFMARNFVRDQITAFSFSQNGFVPILDTLRGAASILRKDDAYQDWMKSGGANAAMVSLDRQYIQTELFKLVGEHPDANFLDKTWNIAKTPVEWLRISSELVENATRVGEFRKATGEAASKSDLLSGAYDSREVTLDFARMGTQVRAMNMITAFFNAQVQGVDRAVRAIKDNPLGTMAKIGAGITLPSIALWLANHDDPRWKDIPGWQRDLFWIVMTKDHIYRIPKPFELGIIFGSGVERMLDAFTGQMSKRDVQNYLGTFGGGILPNFVPTFASPVLEQLTNHSFFTGNQLVPDSLEKMLPEYRYTEYTSELTKALGHIVGTVPAVKDTSIASPVVIDNYLRAWTGGLGTYALQLADAGLRKAGVLPDPVQPTSTLSDIPIIKAFTVRFPSASAESVQQFRNDYQQRKMVYDTFTELAKRGDTNAAMEVMKANPTAMMKLDGIETTLNQQTNLIRMIYRNPEISADQKRQLIDATYYQMIQISHMGNELIKQVDASAPNLRGPSPAH